MIRSILLAGLSTVALSACAAIQPIDTDVDPLAMPAAFEYLQAEAGSPPDPIWWARFGEPELDSLVAVAMLENSNLLTGVERVRQARNSVQTSRASLLPSASGSASTDLQNIDDATSARLSASYVVDLFGANRANLRSSEASLANSIYSQRALELTVQAQVATTYFNILALQQRLDSSRRILDSQERVMDLVQRQYDEGAASGFDLSRQRGNVASTRATIPQLEQQLATNESALAVLLGGFPEGFDVPLSDINDIYPPDIAVGLPSDLLHRRPDLLAAEATLAGAEANIDAARAAFFPSLDLSAGLSFADIVSGPFDNVAESLGASASATLFSGGRLEAQLGNSESRFQQAVIDYRQSVLDAVKEVDDALVTLQTAEQQEELRQISYEEAQRTFDLSEALYEAGAADLLSLLDAQRSLLSASDSLVSARQARLNAAVDLFVALGGGWTPDPDVVRLTEN